jgi:hypothetical protein
VGNSVKNKLFIFIWSFCEKIEKKIEIFTYNWDTFTDDSILMNNGSGLPIFNISSSNS